MQQFSRAPLPLSQPAMASMPSGAASHGQTATETTRRHSDDVIGGVLPRHQGPGRITHHHVPRQHRDLDRLGLGRAARPERPVDQPLHPLPSASTAHPGQPPSGLLGEPGQPVVVGRRRTGRQIRDLLPAGGRGDAGHHRGRGERVRGDVVRPTLRRAARPRRSRRTTSDRPTPRARRPGPAGSGRPGPASGPGHLRPRCSRSAPGTGCRPADPPARAGRRGPRCRRSPRDRSGRSPRSAAVGRRPPPGTRSDGSRADTGPRRGCHPALGLAGRSASGARAGAAVRRVIPRHKGRRPESTGVADDLWTALGGGRGLWTTTRRGVA